MIQGTKYFYDKSIIHLRLFSTLDKHKTKNRHIQMGKKSDSTLLTSDTPPTSAQLSTERDHLNLRYLFLSCLIGNTEETNIV